MCGSLIKQSGVAKESAFARAREFSVNTIAQKVVTHAHGLLQLEGAEKELPNDIHNIDLEGKCESEYISPSTLLDRLSTYTTARSESTHHGLVDFPPRFEIIRSCSILPGR
eukprot:63465_1